MVSAETPMTTEHHDPVGEEFPENSDLQSEFLENQLLSGVCCGF